MWALPELVEAAAGVETPGSRTMPSLDSAQRHNRATPTRRGIEARCQALPASVRRPRSCTAKRSSGWAVPASFRMSPRPPALRRVAVPRGPARGASRAAAKSPRHAHRDRHGGLRERARRELVAVGDKVRKHSDASRNQLTPKRSRSPTSPATAPRTRRSARNCHQRPHRGVAPEPCLHEARHQLAPAAAGRSPQGRSRPDGCLASLPDRTPGTPGVDTREFHGRTRLRRRSRWVVQQPPTHKPVRTCQRRSS